MNIFDLEREFMKKPGYKEAHKELLYDIPFQVSRDILKIRMAKGLSQEKLAKLLKTKQSSIARLERGQGFPSLRMLKNIADALGFKLIPPKFVMSLSQKRQTIKSALTARQPKLRATFFKQKPAYQEIHDVISKQGYQRTKKSA